MYKPEEKWDNGLTRGPPVRALCFGINAYEKQPILDNCENDADAIAERVRALSDGGNGKCCAKVCTNLRDKEAMKAAVSKFLNEIPEEYPPRMVLISFSGHAFQDGENIMMVPSAASGHDNPEKLKEEGFSHNELFSILYEEMHRKTKAKDVYYLFLIDACRETLEGKPHPDGYSSTLEPTYRHPMSKDVPPMCWAMCAGTNRGSLASDAGAGESADNGRFTSHIISEVCGLFEPNVSVKAAIKLACERVQRVKATKDLPQQVPLMLLNNIDDSFCLHKVECLKEHFDVCLCYRRDVPVDLKAATCIGEALRSLGKTVFREANPGQPENIQISKAVCNSSVFVLIISEHTFADINTLHEVSAKQPLANLLQQMEMMLEIYDNCSDYVHVLPVYVGDEVQEPVSLELHIKGVEGRLKCWPAIEQQKLPQWNSMVRQRALKQLRLFNVRIASLLHDRNLDEKLGFPPNTPSLVKGRDVEKTMKIFASVFTAVFMNGRKEDEGKRVCETVKSLLEELEKNRGLSDLRLGKRSASSHHDAGEGSSSVAKRHSSGLPGASAGSKRAYSKAGDDVATKKPRPHAGGGGGGGGGGQGSGGGCAASSDSTQQTFPCGVFISHAWDKDDEGRDNHERAKRLNAGLKRFGMKTWFDEEQMQGDILDCMTRGIKSSAIVLICVTRRYAEKVSGEADNNCKLEFNFAYGKRTSVFMLPVVMEESMTHTSEWGDRLFAVLGFHFYHKLTSDVDDEFDKAVSEIAAAVRTKIDAKLLPDLQQATSSIVQDAMRSREPSPAPSDQSGMLTAPQTPNQDVSLVYVDSTVSDFRDEMTKLMKGFLENPSDQSAPRKWKLCELLLVRFMRDKVAPACDEKMAVNLNFWEEQCQDSESDVIHEFNEMMLVLKSSLSDARKFLEIFDELGYKFADGDQDNHTSVFVIDWMVQHSPWALPVDQILWRNKWKATVVKEWFNPNNIETSEHFLKRAEDFLQKGVKGEKWGIKILGKVIETNSYVAFFRMGALAALLLREYSSQQKISHEHQQKQHAAQETAQKRQRSLPLAISLIVSSSNWHVSFSKGKGPSSARVSDMAWHLQRIACLPAKTLETNQYSFSQLESVKCEPLYNLERMPASMPVVASGGARVGPINAERGKRAIPPMRTLGQKKVLDSEAVGAAVEGAVAALKEQDFVTIHAAFTTCHQSEREARNLMDKACPRSGGNGEGVMAAYNQTQQFDGGQAFADSVWNLGGGGRGGGEAAATAAAGSEEGGKGALEVFPDQFRPMFLVLLDAMHNVQFSDRADAEREEWAAFDPHQFYWQGGADVQLAQIIGGYLHSNILQSPTLREFFGALPQSSDALSEQFQRLLTLPRSAAVAGSMSAIYCFRRIQQELLHPMYAEQHSSWYSVKESLLEILTELQQGAPEDQICSSLQGLFDMMNRKVRGPLKDLHANFGEVHTLLPAG